MLKSYVERWKDILMFYPHPHREVSSYGGKLSEEANVYIFFIDTENILRIRE